MLDALARRTSEEREKSECSGWHQISLCFSSRLQCHSARRGARDGSLLLSKNPPSFSLPLTESGGRGVGRVRLGHDGVGHRRHRCGMNRWGKSSELLSSLRRRGKGRCDWASERVEQNPKWLLLAVRDTCERDSRARTAGEGAVTWGSDNRHVRKESKEERRDEK